MVISGFHKKLRLVDSEREWKVKSRIDYPITKSTGWSSSEFKTVPLQYVEANANMIFYFIFLFAYGHLT